MVSERPQLDLLSTAEVVNLMLDAEQRVVPAVREQVDRIAAAAALIADRYRVGGRIVFAGAGTSGRVALAEAAELPGTFGLPTERVRVSVAGMGSSLTGTDADEDDLEAAATDLGSVALQPDDVLVAVAASGSTPYTLAFADAARSVGAAVVAVTNRTGTPLAGRADVAVETVIGPEVLRESSRLCAGTSQKVALNAMTTAAMVLLGKVHDDHMIDVVPANAKLQQRVAGIVAEIAGCEEGAAREALASCGGNARAAIAHIVLGVEPEEALARTERFATLREALAS